MSRQAIGCVDRTIIWYRWMLCRYQDWLTETNHTFDTVGLLQLQEFTVTMRNQYSPSTASQMATVLITFYRWCAESKLIAEDPTKKFKKPKVPDTIPSIVARSYVQHMLNKIRPIVWTDHRDRCLNLLMFSTGLRVTEVVELRLDSIDLDAKRITVLGKGGKLRIQPISDQLAPVLWQWLNTHRPQAQDEAGKPLPWLFFAASGRSYVRGPVTSQGIRDILRRCAEAAALDWKSQHAYRHGFAVDLLKKGASTRLVQKLMGHANIETTEKYLKLSPDDVQSMFDGLWVEDKVTRKVNDTDF
jgi:integrase/recombinase XerD